MQAVSKGLEKVELELAASENDGAISVGFRKVRILTEFSLPIRFYEENANCNIQLLSYS